MIDGKQRLETIFLFSGKLFPEQLAVDPTQKNRIKDWLSKDKLSSSKEDYKKAFNDFTIPVGQLKQKDDKTDNSDQGMGDVIAAFVRINTQGKPLTKQEQTNATYITSPLLLMAKKLTTSFHRIFKMSPDQIGRMKDVEITLELLITILKKETLDRKTAINVALENKKDIKNKEKRETSSQFKAIIGLLKKLNLGKSAKYVRSTSDFYSLFKALLDLHNSKSIFKNRKNFAKANKELATFSAKVAEITDAHKNKKHGYLKKHINAPYSKYWDTTRNNTDSKENRDVRTNILKEIIGRSFDRQKDKKRFFSVNQKERIWESSNKKCSWPGCGKKLTWDTATGDHVSPWSQGGFTEVANAQLMCRRHNSMKKDKEFLRFFVSKKRR